MSSKSSIEIKGLDEAKKTLETLAQKAKKLDGTHTVPTPDLFTPVFMARFTDFASFKEMVEQSGFEISTQDDFEKLPEDQWDVFIRGKTKFSSWQEMLKRGGEEYVISQLGL